MRYILGLCVVLAAGSPAWTNEMRNATPDDGAQVYEQVNPTLPSSGAAAVTTQVAPTTTATTTQVTTTTATIAAEPKLTGPFALPAGAAGVIYPILGPGFLGGPELMIVGSRPPTEVELKAFHVHMAKQAAQAEAEIKAFHDRLAKQAAEAAKLQGLAVPGYPVSIVVGPGFAPGEPVFAPPIIRPVPFYYGMPAVTVPNTKTTTTVTTAAATTGSAPANGTTAVATTATTGTATKVSTAPATGVTAGSATTSAVETAKPSTESTGTTSGSSTQPAPPPPSTKDLPPPPPAPTVPVSKSN